MYEKLMKGHTFAKGKKKLTYPATAEVKLDEIRLDVRRSYLQRVGSPNIAFQSYADKPLHNLHPYAGSFNHAMYANQVARLDMGVLINRNFNDTYRYVRSSKKLPDDLRLVSVEFILFDDPNLKFMPYSERKYYLDDLARRLNDYDLSVIRPERIEVHSEEEVFDAYGKARERGFEGLMVKTHDHLYEVGKRSYGWLKVKPEEDADGIITAINQAHSIEGEPLDRAGSVLVKCEDGSECNVPGIDHDLGRAMLATPSAFIGQWCEFQFMERDRQGGYRHPRFHRIREDKA